MVGCELEQIPQVAVQVSKYRHGAVVGSFRFTDELDTFGDHIVLSTPPQLV